MLIKGLNEWISYGYHKKFSLHYCIDESKYTPFSDDWQHYLQHKVEYSYHNCVVRSYKTNNTPEALEKLYSLIKEFAPKYNLKKLQHEMRLKLIKGI